MKKPIDLGLNRTGIGTSPIDSKAVIEGAREGVPLAASVASDLLQFRASFSRGAEPVGTMPPPASLKGAATAVLEKLQGQSATVLLDLLGERLAFERSGVRLYESLLIKYDAAHVHAGGPTAEELERIRDQELKHFGMLRRALEGLGADPTVMTPSADIIGVAGMGLVQVLGDPRTTFTQGLRAILVAELTDNDSWLVLTELVDRMGHTDLASEFRLALAEEEEHLVRVRSWLSAALFGQAGIEPERQPITPLPPTSGPTTVS